MASMVTIAPPVRKPRLGGISTVATVQDVPRLGMGETINYVSDGCSFPAAAIGLCYGPTIHSNKSSVGIDIENGVGPFGYYAGVECYLGVGTDGEYRERARNILRQGLDRAIEGEMNTWLVANTDAAGGPATSFAEGLAILDNSADFGYIGEPVILMNRGDAVLASAEYAIQWGLNGPMTINGTPIAASARFPAGTMYVTGGVTILRSDEVDISAPHPTTNRDWAIAEATFGFAFDCGFAQNVAVTAG
jgi:hypothetical protein